MKVGTIIIFLYSLKWSMKWDKFHKLHLDCFILQFKHITRPLSKNTRHLFQNVNFPIFPSKLENEGGKVNRSFNLSILLVDRSFLDLNNSLSTPPPPPVPPKYPHFLWAQFPSSGQLRV